MLDLNYDEATGTLKASSVDFLIIENNDLGYKIRYLLTSFVKNGTGKDGQRLHFQGAALFEEMHGTAPQEKRWLKKRQEAYEGSMMHFLRSGLENRIDEEGFRVQQLANYQNTQRPPDSLITAMIKRYKGLKIYRDSLTFWTKKENLSKTFQTLLDFPLKPDDIIKLTDQKGVFALGCNNDALQISWNKNHRLDYGNYIRLNDANSQKVTIVTFNTPYAFFDTNGGGIDPNWVSFTGTWADNRMAELLPVDYEPLNINAINNKVVAKNAASTPSGHGDDTLRSDLLKLTAASDSLNHVNPVEKLYLQLDRPYYALSDTIWFKAYLFNAAYLTASDKSGILNIDIANDSNKVVKQYRIPIQRGLGWGNISLDEKDFKTGTYTIRAYTNWMRNFGGEYFFYKSFYITGPAEGNWLVNKQVITMTTNGIATANVKLQLSDINKTMAANTALQLQVLSGGKHLYRQAMQTDKNGMLDVNFKLPEKSAGLALVVQNELKKKKDVIPLNLNRPEMADVQFLPEGGSLVAGLPTHIGFKAIGGRWKGH